MASYSPYVDSPSSDYNEFRKQIAPEDQATGFEFDQMVSMREKILEYLRLHGEGHRLEFIFEVANKSAVINDRLKALTALMPSKTDHILTKVIKTNKTLDYGELKLTITMPPTNCVAGPLVYRQMFTVKTPGFYPPFEEIFQPVFSALQSFNERLFSLDFRAVATVFGIAALLLSAFYGRYRHTAAAGAATLAGVGGGLPVAGPFDQGLQAFLNGMNIGTAIPSGQELTAYLNAIVESTTEVRKVTFGVVWTKMVKYDVRKNFADTRMRVKGRFVKKEDEALLREVMACA